MFLFFSSSLSLVSLSLSLPLSLFVSLSQPSNHTHHWPLATTIPTTITMIKDPCWSNRSSWRSTSINSMIYTGHVDDPRTQTHEPRPINPNPWTQTHKPRPTKSSKHNHRQSTLIGEPYQRSIEREKRRKKWERKEKDRRERTV